jgi:anti-anti-sigma factor
MSDFEKLYLDGVVVIVVNITRCNIYHQKNFKKTVDEEIKSGQCKFIIDFSKCESVDSFFEGAIIGTTRKMLENDRELKIVEPEKIVEDVFTKTDSHQLFDLYKTSADAIKSFGEDVQLKSW